jgi:hypothetical protein
MHTHAGPCGAKKGAYHLGCYTANMTTTALMDGVALFLPPNHNAHTHTQALAVPRRVPTTLGATPPT